MCSDLVCPLCSTSTFPDIESFKLNLIKVNSKPIKCPLCAEILLGLDKLTIHLFGHSLPLPCEAEMIIKPLPQDDETPQKAQKKISTPKQSRIKLVKMTSSSSSSLSPSSPQKASTDENFRCEICGFLFFEEQLLNLHLNLVHNFTPNGNNGSDEQFQLVQSSGNASEIRKWNCHLCGKHFKMKGALRIHIRVAHVRFHDQNQRQINIADFLRSQKSIDMCTKQAEMLSLQDPYSPQNSPQYTAVSSPAAVSSPLNHELQQQLKVAEGVTKNLKTFQCDECLKNFTTKYFLKKHKRLHTGGLLLLLFSLLLLRLSIFS